MSDTSGRHWWQEAVFYQVYLRSFADANGDGIGDFRGMIDRLDYLADLGIDAIWLSPHYASPQVDLGYDVADYRDVAAEYGTLDDFKEFLAGAHRRGIRVILDLVLNHTSDQHAWFVESRAGRDARRRDWYVWRDGRGDQPPNNWESLFGGSAWEHDRATNQYYYHAFFKEQPDLNWRHPEVKAAMWAVIRFWLDLGVDGIRLDAVGTIFEDQGLTDHASARSLPELRRASLAATSEAERAGVESAFEELFRHQAGLPEVHSLMRELRAVVDEYPDRVLVGETDDVAFYGFANDELHLVFNFPLMRTDWRNPSRVRANQRTRGAATPTGAWPANTLGNHDESRVRTRLATSHADAALARIAAALVLMLPGTPFLYYGEEIGMTDLLLDDLALFRDHWGLRQYRESRDALALSRISAVAHGALHGRDKSRTPMQWTPAANAGFSPAATTTWLPVHPNHAEGVNVLEQRRDPTSLLNWYRRLIRLRRRTPALRSGACILLDEGSDDCLAFLRRSADSAPSYLVVLNMSSRPQKFRVDASLGDARRLLSSTEGEHPVDRSGGLDIGPYEACIAELVGTRAEKRPNLARGPQPGPVGSLTQDKGSGHSRAVDMTIDITDVPPVRSDDERSHRDDAASDRSPSEA